MLKFHWDILWSFHYRHYVLLCTALAREAWTYATKMTRMLLSSTCEEQRSVMWANGHNPIEMHWDMCSVYGEHCIDHSNVSRWCAFFKQLRLEEWAHLETLIGLIQSSPNTPHMSLWISLALCPWVQKNRTNFATFHTLTTVSARHLCCVIHASLARAAH